MMDFTLFYRAIHNREPFVWQVELAHHLLNGRWCDVLDLPPSSGKTSIIDIWYYALYGTALDVSRSIPIRLAYAVGRKAIVDAAYEDATKLQAALNNSLQDVGKTVCNFFGCNQPLVVGKIRGGMDREERNRWITTPNQPVIVSCTVDQLGSRALFRGYGVGPKMRSIDASMMVVDTLMVLDESHLNQGLVQTLQTVIDTIDVKVLGKIPKSRILQLSATADSDKTSFDLPIKDQELQRRIKAKRITTLCRSTNPITAIVNEQIKRLSKNGKVIAVILNTVAKARKVFDKIDANNKVLLVGRVRNFERLKLSKNEVKKLLAGRDRSADEPFIVVATQTIEVGVNFDFDAMITEAAPLDCLIQRLGRLDRLGHLGSTEAVILLDDNGSDPVYAGKSCLTFDWLEQQYGTTCFNFSEVKRNNDLFADKNHYPQLVNGIIKLLAITHPAPDISVSGYLHGVSSREQADISIAYRAELNFKMLKENRTRPVNKSTAAAWIKMIPRAHPNEIINLPLGAIFQKEISDTEFGKDQQTKSDLRIANQLCVRNRDLKIIRMAEAKTGDLLFVPCEFGRHDCYGWNPTDETRVEDVADLTGNIVRLHSTFFPGFELAKFIDDDGVIDYEEMVDALRNKQIPKWIKSGDKYIRHRAYCLEKHLDEIQSSSPQKMTPDGSGIYFYFGKKSFGSKKSQDLFAHNTSVGQKARFFAAHLGLNPGLVEILGLAGDLHDVGKTDPRFQANLYWPNIVDPNKPLAKSGYVTNRKTHTPRGWRHELQSLAIVRQHNLGSKCIDVELLEHLIASHHGWFRPFFPISDDPNFEQFVVNATVSPQVKQPISSTQPYFDVCARMDRSKFDGLNQKYGYWGLAFLETILRLADHEGSM